MATLNRYRIEIDLASGRTTQCWTNGTNPETAAWASVTRTEQHVGIDEIRVYLGSECVSRLFPEDLCLSGDNNEGASL